MKKLYGIFTVVFILTISSILHAQTNTLPHYGTYWVQGNGNNLLPYPIDPYDGLMDIVVLNATNHIYLIQDTPEDYAALQEFKSSLRSEMMSMESFELEGGDELMFPHWTAPT
ncbi:MAG TPA: hypothetical protein VN516_03070, partial [Candidatus Baltobacteraceae bacterium]|nr:hypothetical protein [Candidatus Baltobacteraceae bacterium]